MRSRCLKSHLHCVLADVKDAWGEDWRRWASFRDSELDDEIRCDIRDSKGAKLVPRSEWEVLREKRELRGIKGRFA
jgi:hypothetical protein